MIEGVQKANTRKTKDPKTGTEKEDTLYHARASLKIQWKLQSWPSRALLSEGATVSEQKSDDQSIEYDLPDWLKKQDKLTAAAEERIVVDLVPRSVSRFRPILKGDTDSSKAAFKSAADGDWKAAGKAW